MVKRSWGGAGLPVVVRYDAVVDAIPCAGFRRDRATVRGGIPISS